MEEKPLKIAVIGSGVAGLTAAYLLQRRHTITLFEKNAYVGGHTNTIVIPSGPEKWTSVDTGFVVFNERNYPNFQKLLNQLEIPTRPCDLSFAYFDEKNGFQYSFTNLNGLLAQRSNLWSPSFWWMLWEIGSFNRHALKDLRLGKLGDMTISEYLAFEKYSYRFTHDYLMPLGAAIWAISVKEVREIPAANFIQYMHFQGFLGLRNRLQWKTVVEGSHQYVRALLKKSVMRVKVGDPVEEIFRKPPTSGPMGQEGQVVVKTKSGKEETFDKVVMACHADEALGLLTDPSEEEQRLLSPWRYEKNFAVLHTDKDVLPPHSRSWAAWNYTREKETTMSEPVSLTYHMNRIQGLDNNTQYFVTFNRLRPIQEKHILKEIYYTHPIYTKSSIETQKDLPKLNGVNNTYFCGSYFGYGFHEDAVKSAAAVGQSFGIEL